MKRQLDSFGMGKDMRDVLEEIIQMEKGFTVDYEDGEAPPGLFTATFDRPPRTPSPMAVDKRVSSVPQAPGAPPRGHRSSNSISHPQQQRQPSPKFAQPRPPSAVGQHQSSLSESHTALYLATASPHRPSRRSASPKLKIRKSLSFNPEVAGPTILNGHLLAGGVSADSPAHLTPSRRRLNISPTAYHPTIDHWRFPSGSGSGSNAATPTRPTIQEQPSDPNQYETPVRPRPTVAGGRIEPQLLWPPPAPPLAPALFPSSPAASTPDFPSFSRSMHNATTPTGSGLRLGVLMGSTDEGMEIDGEDEDDGSTTHVQGTYLPVYLEAEGFRTQAFR